MVHNVGTVERIARFVLGCALVVIGVNLGGAAMWILLAASLLPFSTAAVRYCPVTHAIGISTEGNTVHRLRKS